TTTAAACVRAIEHQHAALSKTRATNRQGENASGRCTCEACDACTRENPFFTAIFARPKHFTRLCPKSRVRNEPSIFDMKGASCSDEIFRWDAFIPRDCVECTVHDRKRLGDHTICRGRCGH